MQREIGKYLVVDPDIHHGAITFRGTRIPVSFVLEDVAEGMAWDAIIEQWHGSVSREAIGEAVRLASAALVDLHRQAPRTAAARA